MNAIATVPSTVVYAILIAAAAPVVLVLMALGGRPEGTLPHDEDELARTASAQRSSVG